MKIIFLRQETGCEKWDIPSFQPYTNADIDPSEESQKMELIMKIMKVFVYIFTFVIVLTSSIISKSSMLFMTSQLNQNKVMEVCKQDLERYTSAVPQEELIRWTWCIVIAYSFPEICYFMRSIRICIFKSSPRPLLKVFIIVATLETLNAIGHSLLLFCILPNLDAICGAMISTCLFLIPGVIDYKEIKKTTSISAKNTFLLSLDIFAVLSQISGLLVWPIVYGGKNWQLLTLPCALIFISASWWENYASSHSDFSIIRSISKIKVKINKSRYFIYTIISVWKIIVFLCMSILCWHLNGLNIYELFSRIPEIFSPYKVTFSESLAENISRSEYVTDISNDTNFGKDIQLETSHQILIYCLAIQLLSGYVCHAFGDQKNLNEFRHEIKPETLKFQLTTHLSYFICISGKFACKVCMQIFSFAFPLTLAVPMTVTVLIIICMKHSENPCYFNEILSTHLFFKSPSTYDFHHLMFEMHVWLWAPWFISQIWITRHIWTPKFHRVAPTEELFVNSSYSAALVDPSIIASRRKADEAHEEVKDSNSHCNYYGDVNLNTDSLENKSSDCTTQIYVCATLWHEREDEMKNLLKSIFYLDSDQSARETAQIYFKVKDPDYYKLEVNIFFDDAFELDDDEHEAVNVFVKIFVDTISLAASEVHEQVVKLRPPLKCSTPYGGRLVWTLPGKNKMIVHLKDKTKIKIRKRWSLVMNTYYILGYQLLCSNIDVAKKEKQAENTYILALDGDVSFKPKALQLLIDRMKKNTRVGAVCGRIHPLGSGPMVWYQRFEYAIAHWFQKATENVIGSVLCSPGCFSLYRSEALLQVANEYTTRPTEAKHYFQFEQGEDRWLSTLLLQKGFLIEYCAASDAHTHVPETFYEFYNQRTRWIPSTIINTVDLITKFKRFASIHGNISSLYIGYQMIVTAGNFMGPGAVLLLLTAAFQFAFGFDVWSSFIFNFIPVIIFILICLTTTAKIQKGTALLLSTAYGLVMMAILAVTITQMIKSGPFAPVSFFGCTLLGGFLLAALLHPMECGCMIHGFIFYLAIPSMYLLLVVYAVFNLNGVKWGTREIVPIWRLKKNNFSLIFYIVVDFFSFISMAQNQLMDCKEPRQRKYVLSIFKSADNEMGSFECSLAGLFKCLFCTHNDGNREQEREYQLEVSKTLTSIDNRLKKLESGSKPEATLDGTIFSTLPNSLEETAERENQNDVHSIAISAFIQNSISSDEENGNAPIKPHWTTEFPPFEKAKFSPLGPNENKFWVGLIDKYLYPQLPAYSERTVIVELNENFRNKCIYAFIMLNAFFVVTILSLQTHQESLSMKWPLGTRSKIKFAQESRTCYITKTGYQLDPIGLTIVFLFGVPLIIQLICMCIHCMRTFCHILSSTQLKKDEHIHENQHITPDFALEITREWQRLRGVDTDLQERSQNVQRETMTNDEVNGLSQNATALVEFLRKIKVEDRPRSPLHQNQSGQRGTIMVIESNRNKKRINSHDIAFKRRIESINPALLEGTVFGKRPSERNSSLGLVQDIITEETEL
ncbi:hypothetical protein J437_LFUL005668 [Ladona fulva]|uniref:chitin synthase n=1 Tax=Ladona fulva TaxID=123851 RepID=A0A8K0NUD1_LADFU|nr:hypothetical protein J437_LFUL005668 [Ladona fulva]